MRKRSVARGRRAIAILLAAGLAGCGSGSGQGGSGFVFLSVDSVAPGVANASLATDTPTVVCFTLRNNLKNPTVTAPTALDNVVIQSYTVTLRRLDGAATLEPFSLGSGVTVPAGTAAAGGPAVSGNTAVVPVVVVPGDAKRRLGGPGTATAEVVFNGRDRRGERVETEGAVTVNISTGGPDNPAACVG
jgi:hypothetical protein